MRATKSIFLLLCLAGCAQEIELTYKCTPSGAMMLEEGMGDVGPCPSVLRYSSFDTRIRGNKLRTNAIYIWWPSGASILVPPTDVTISPEGKAALTFCRPENYPNEPKDIAFARVYERRVPTPKKILVVNAAQDRDIFESLNNSFSCAMSGLTRSQTARCK
jgi:hypothetical protein